MEQKEGRKEGRKEGMKKGEGREGKKKREGSLMQMV
jgi:hypothetical protein